MKTSLLTRFCFPGLLLLGLATLFSGCESTGSSKSSAAASPEVIPPSPTVLRVGVAPDMPPFAFMQNGKMAGLEVDLAKELGPALGRETRFIPLDWDDLISALQNDQIDILMAGMNYTPERAAIILMTTPYMRSGQMALVLRKNASNFTFPGMIGNTRANVGAEDGTTGAYLVQSSFPNATLVTYPSAEAGAEGLIDGEVELFISDAPTVYWLAGTYQNKGVMPARPVLTEDLMVWGVARDNPELLGQVNVVIRKWAEDGTLNRITSRWITLP